MGSPGFTPNSILVSRRVAASAPSECDRAVRWGTAVIGIVSVEQAIHSATPLDYFIGSRLVGTTGYPNATAAAFLISFWPALYLGSRRELGLRFGEALWQRALRRRGISPEPSFQLATYAGIRIYPVASP